MTEREWDDVDEETRLEQDNDYAAERMAEQFDEEE